MIRCASRTGRCMLTALLAWAASSPCHAAPPPITLNVRTLRAAGGESGVELKLPARLTAALTQFLRDHADASLRVETPDRAVQTGERLPATRYTLESDLSYASGQGEESGRYLLVTRLIRQGRPSALICQWAGSASSLRYLTANLRNDPRVHTLGLIGEIGSRVLAAVASDAAGSGQQWGALWPRLTPMRSQTAPMIAAETPYSPLSALIAGGKTFRLRLPSSAGSRSYLLTSGSNNRVEVLPLTPTERQDTPADAAQAASQTLHLPEGTREAWLLCRIPTVKHGTASTRTYGRISRLCAHAADEDDAPVHILNGVGTNLPMQKEASKPLLEEIARDSGSWRVLRLHVTTPHK